ncbi:MAG: T9SS type A sorting domain-containing protein [Ignavibacteriaceae bacterium]
MKNLLLLIIILTSINIYPQNWLKVDSIFSVSGVTVKSFSAPEFADLNNDGNPDLIIGNLDDKADFFWNNSHDFPTTFWKDTSVLSNVYQNGQTNTNAAYPTFIDLDGDIDRDLVIGGYNGLRYYQNIGTISLPEFVAVDTIFANVNTQIGTDAQPAFVDIDDDGDLDLFMGIGESFSLDTTTFPEAGITLGFRNTGTASNPMFTLDNTLVTGIPDIGLNSYPTFVDLDNDEDFDLVFGRDLQTLVYYRNTGTKQNPIWTANTTTFSGVETSSYWKNPTFSDLDYDGDFDLIYGTDDGVLYSYRNIGTVTSPSFQNYPDYFKIVKLDAGGATVSLADFDNDGDNDLLSGTWLGKFVYFKNDGTSTKPNFKVNTTAFSNLTVNSYSSPIFVDIDKDLDYDIVSGALSGQVFLYINNNGTFTQNATMFSGIDVGWMSIPSFADLDNDGDLDLLVGGETGSETKYYTNDGNNVFTVNTTAFSSVTFPSYGRPILADFDNDGDYDLTIGDAWGTVKYYRNDGTVNAPVWFRYDAMFAGIEVDQNPHAGFADLDNDGRKDMIIGEYNGNFTYYQNLFAEVTDVENEIDLSVPDDFVLNQNYPNPFNPSTIISWQSPVSGWQTLKVYDVLGKEVATLVNEFKPIGKYEIEFNASTLSSGVYFYQLKIENFTAIRKFLFVK